MSSPASGEIFGSEPAVVVSYGFQFIEFPSEWGADAEVREIYRVNYVSNLLSSPASGERDTQYLPRNEFIKVSNLLSSPASGE